MPLQSLPGLPRRWPGPVARSLMKTALRRRGHDIAKANVNLQRYGGFAEHRAQGHTDAGILRILE